MVYFQPSAGALPPWMSAAPATQRNSNGMRTSGIVLFAAGAVLTAVGGVVFGAVATTGCPDVTVDDGVPDPRAAPEGSAERVRSARQALNGCDTSPVVGAGLIAAGMLTAAVGVPLFVIGSKRVPAQNVTGKLVPEVSLGAAHGSLRWLF